MKSSNSLASVLAFFLIVSGVFSEEAKAPLFDNLGKLHHAVTTKDKLAQRYFDQGLTLSYAFNHAEAERSFREAARLDPDCAMAYWGIALVLGPNYNLPMDPSAVTPAYEAVQQALKLAPTVSAHERAYIQAISKRYAEKPPEDRSSLDAAYETEMEKVTKQYPDDADAFALYAEALMDLHPWDLYTREGKPKDWTPQIVNTLEKGMARWPQHPGFHHFYIHAVEASDHPEKGLHCVDLPNLVPGAGHLVHMPAHIYIRTGRYLDAVKANENAIAADDKYAEGCHAQGVYPIGYMPHNHHFLVASAMLAGMSEKAISAAKYLAEHQDSTMMQNPDFGSMLQHFSLTPIHAMVRFGKWYDILKLPAPNKDYEYPTAMWHYGHGLAELRTGRSDEAEKDLQELNQIADDPKLKDVRILGFNKITDLLQIAGHVLAGEIAAQSKEFDQAIDHLQEAVKMEDALMYQEPADWYPSTRQNLGAVFLLAGRAADAENVYRKDLEYVRENGWSLYGLAQSLRAQGKNEEAEKVERQFKNAWSQADVQLTASRF